MKNDKSANKFEYISGILVHAKDANDVLNDQNINIKADFQYICLSSGNNYDIVTDVIAKIADNGEGAVIEENINLISMNMWKDLFCKNDSIKSIFINNFDAIYANTNVMTCTEVEAFINDKKTSSLIYAYLDDVIVKLTTQDRATLITILNDKKNGANLIKQNLHNFFKKGTYGISTTYSKILTRLEKIKGIEKIDILRACIDSLSDMISKATAFENETVKVILWVNKALDEADIGETERKYLNDKIDRAIINNYDSILEKTNYSIENATLLKKYEAKRDALNKKEKAEEQVEQEQSNENISAIEEKESIEETAKDSIKISKAKGELGVTKKYELSNDLINSYINRYNKKKKISEEVLDEKDAEQELQEKLQKLIYNNIHQTDVIVDKVLKKDEPEVTKASKQEVKTEEKVEEKNEKIKVEKKVAIVQDNPIKTNEKIVANDGPIKTKENNISHEPVSKQKSLTLVNPEAKRFLKKGFIKRIVKRVLKIFGYQKEKRKIDDVWS